MSEAGHKILAGLKDAVDGNFTSVTIEGQSWVRVFPAARQNQRAAFWTHDDKAAPILGHLYYFAPVDRAAPPYKTQRHVSAIIDIAEDGTLAGVELIDDMPPPPVRRPSP